MSNTRKAKARRRSRYHAMFDEEIAVLPGWAHNEDAVEECQQQTHDALIRLLGDRRAGAVSWRIINEVPAALELLTKMAEGADAPHLEFYKKLEELLREHGGVLVIATAPGRVPANPRSN